MKPFEKDILANDKNWLVTKYIVENLSILEISKLCKVSPDTIRTRLAKFEIEIKNRDCANKISVKNKPAKYRQTEATKNKHKRQENGQIVSCDNCGKEKYKPKCRLTNLNFCSIICRDEYLRKNVNRNQDWRDFPEYDIWRKLVYQRDGWKCVLCKSKIRINAHHIYEGSDHPDKRFSVDNGITLCEHHHIMLHKNSRSFIKELIKQTSNIGGHLEEDNPEASIRTILYALTTTKRHPERMVV